VEDRDGGSDDGADDGAGDGAGVEPVTRRPADQAESARANRSWWDAEAAAYLAEHGSFLGPSRGAAGFVWGPEGLTEDEAGLLGDVTGAAVLEVGAGAAQCSRWLLAHGARPVALDLSIAMLAAGRQLAGRELGGQGLGDDVAGLPGPPLVQADAARLPFADRSFDLACSAYGGLPFVADSAAVLRDVARVLRPGGRFVFSLGHPIRWCLPDDPGPGGLVVRDSYFDRTPYVEQDLAGTATYVEHHRTLGDRVREITAAGLRLVDLVEPEWPAGNDRTWGGWSPLRGALVPGTAIFVCVKD
jgi:SAM-dependent methyltransferase